MASAVKEFCVFHTIRRGVCRGRDIAHLQIAYGEQVVVKDFTLRVLSARRAQARPRLERGQESMERLRL